MKVMLVVLFLTVATFNAEAAKCDHNARCTQDRIFNMSKEQVSFLQKAYYYGAMDNKGKTAIAIIIEESDACVLKRSVVGSGVGEDYGCWGNNITTILALLDAGAFSINPKYKNEGRGYQISLAQKMVQEDFGIDSHLGMLTLLYWWKRFERIKNPNVRLMYTMWGYHAGYRAFKWSKKFKPESLRSAKNYWKRINTVFRSLNLDDGAALKFILGEK